MIYVIGTISMEKNKWILYLLQISVGPAFIMHGIAVMKYYCLIKKHRLNYRNAEWRIGRKQQVYIAYTGLGHWSLNHGVLSDEAE